MALVLVVDDDVAIAQMVARVVEFYGHEPAVETNSLDAAQRCAQWGSDLGAAIVDYMMPGLDGVELLVVVQQTVPSARRILLTASPKEPAVQTAWKEGVIHKVVGKPPTLHDLEVVLAWL